MNDWRQLYPFKSYEIMIRHLRMHYLDEGEGEVLLLLHGNPTWSFYWRNIISGLRDKYRLIVPDHIGCGFSEKPSRREYPFTLRRRVEDILELVEKLDLRNITLLAHDWGGAIGMGAAVFRPERFSRFILCNTAAFRFPGCPGRIALCRIPVFGDVAVKGFNVFARAAIKMAVMKKERMDSVTRAGLLAPYDSWNHRLAVHEFVRDIPFRPGQRSYDTLVEIEHGLKKLNSRPVCLIWGNDWCFTPKFMERFQEYFPVAEPHFFPDAGHYIVEDKYEQMIPIIDDFMQRFPLSV
ncbi:MAG: alpha/beta fold hydrolase [Planctomycetia bacterium]|nr:alpha/beta fold hydrolase [Planctomycetia bacterium]